MIATKTLCRMFSTSRLIVIELFEWDIRVLEWWVVLFFLISFALDLCIRFDRPEQCTRRPYVSRIIRWIAFVEHKIYSNYFAVLCAQIEWILFKWFFMNVDRRQSTLWTRMKREKNNAWVSMAEQYQFYEINNKKVDRTTRYWSSNEHICLGLHSVCCEKTL